MSVLMNHPAIPQDGYDSAIVHYTNLKNKMLDQFAERSKNNLKKNGLIENINNNIEEELFKETSSTQDAWNESYQMLNRIEDVVGDMIVTGKTNGVQHLINTLKSEINKNNQDIKSQQKKIKKSLRDNQDNIFKELKIKKTFFKNLINSVQGVDTIDIERQLSSYFVRYLYARLEQEDITGSKFYNTLVLAGFYKESIEYELLHKKLNNVFNIIHAGPKDSEMDILITSLNNVDKIFNENEQLNKELSALPSNIDILDLKNNLFKQIDWYGEQVKSWSLGSGDALHIGNRADLYNKYLNEGGNPMSSLQGAIFLSHFQNILRALGPANVLFSSNKSRQWMCDFIQNFRKQRYTLAFERKNNNEALNSSIVLERFLTDKQNIRQRYLA